MNMEMTEKLYEKCRLPYKLEQHLIEVCNNSTYANLLSVWNINKKMCQDALSTVVVNYPHYTKHDISHSEAILTNIEMLLGEEAIKILSPTDTWLLLQAAYLHDIGMVIECKKIEENWNSKEFQDYLHYMETSNDDSLAENAKFINSLGDKLEKKEDVFAWPVRVRYAVTLLIAAYYRNQHAKDSKSYIEDMGRIFHIDLGFNGLIQQRLIMLLADIVYLHTESSKKILELDYQTNGFNSDYVHPRFLAQMLRMGDLLDADNNRFNMANEVVFGKIPKSSKNHLEKHRSARHILITPDIIEYRADCYQLDVYRETRIFVSWLKEEVEFWSLNWKNIMPEVIRGSAPKLGKCELLLNGVPDIQGISDLRFSIAPEKAFELIEGSNIYEDSFVFLREVIQNALDACKTQLWRDISEGRYRSWISHTGDGDIQPFEIEQTIFDNYRVEVRLHNYDENHFKVIIKDNGIGLSVEQLKKICDVGVSYLGDKNRKEEISGMPLWLRPTAGFGIGLQSIFLVADEFEIYSKSSAEEGIYARVASRRRNGYVQITKSNALKTQGTEIHIILSHELDFKYSMGSNIYEYIKKVYDPFLEQKNLLYYKIWDVLRDAMECTYFPIEIYFEDKLVDSISSQLFNRLEEKSQDGRYMFRTFVDYRIELWDIMTCTRMQIKLQEKYEPCNNRCFFKGMEMKNGVYSPEKGIWYKVDFYGLDTKKTLTLDRKRIRKEAIKEINEIVDSAIKFFLNIVEKNLLKQSGKREKVEYNQIYTYWCIASLEDKVRLLKGYNEVFKNIQVPITVLVKKGAEFFKEEHDFKEVIGNLQQTANIYNLRSYIDYSLSIERLNEELIISILNKKNLPFSKIIIDKNFIELMNDTLPSKIMIVVDGGNIISLTSYSADIKELPEVVDEDTKDYLLKSLLKKSASGIYHSFYTESMRRYIIGIKEYAPLSTNIVPFGIAGEWYPSIGYIISPVTISQWQSTGHLKVDDFVNDICSREEFSNLVNYVYVHQADEKKYSKEEIIKTYEKLIEDMYIAKKKNLNEC